MRYGTVCSGIEAPSAAWHPLGWDPVFFSEIEPFPSAVLAHHYPKVPNRGDMTKFKEWPNEPVDLICGGTPCQSFSVAGLRKGLDDPRGNLTLTYLALLDRFRPKWMVWENVPGVLSDRTGAFGAFLGGLGQLGYGFAYRVLDAQYAGVPQRRRRVFVVGCLGNWRLAAAVLFERHSLQGHSAPSRTAGKEIATTLASRSRSGSGYGPDTECPVIAQSVDTVAGPITSGMHKGMRGTEGIEPNWMVPTNIACMSSGQGNAEIGNNIGTTLTTLHEAPIVAGTICKDSFNGGAGGRPEGAAAGHFVPTYGIAGNIIGRQPENGGNGEGWHEDVGYTLTKTDIHAVAFAQNTRDEVRELGGNIAGALAAQPGMKQQTYLLISGVNHASAQETHAGTLLSRVRGKIGEKAFAQWELGILDSLQSPEVLRSALHGSELRPATFSRRWVVYCALSRTEDRAAGAMLSLREAVGEGCPSQGWESLEQLSGQLGAYLSELSQPGAQAERFMRDLWRANEGIGLLRETLSAIQKTRQPSTHEGKSAYGGMQVRRLTVEECEFLQGFPRGYTNIPYRNKPAADGPRYKALGNSMAVPVVRWIGERINAVEKLSINLRSAA